MKKGILISFFCLVIIACTITYTQINQEQVAQSSQEKEQSIDKLALQTFNHTFQHMFSLVEQPRDKQNIISNVSAIVSGIFNFVAQAVHHKQKDDFYIKLNNALQNVLDDYLQTDIVEMQ